MFIVFLSRVRILMAGIAVTTACLSGAQRLNAQGLPEFETVVFTGDQVPGEINGVTFTGFSPPSLNASGQTAFIAGLAGDVVNLTNNSGVYSGDSGILTQVARRGDQVPGADIGVVFNFFNLPTLTDSGQTGFTASLTGTGVDYNNDNGIYRGGSGTVTEIAREGSQVPGASNGVMFAFTGFNPPVFNESGQVAFITSLTGNEVTADNDTAIYRDNASGILSLVAREGGLPSNADDGVVFTSFQTPMLNASGQITFRATITPDVSGVSDQGIYSESSGSLTSFVLAGDQVPGLADDVVFNDFNFPIPLNSLGQTAFLSSFLDLGGNLDNRRGIFSGGSGSLSLIAREGDEAPGDADGAMFTNFGFPVFNDSGHTAFVGFLFGPEVDFNTGAIYSDASGSLVEIARENTPVPGAGSVVFDSFSRPVLNTSGQIAFASSVTGSGYSFSNGIYATDLDGQLVEIARTGELFDVNDDPLVDDLREINSLSFFANIGDGNGGASPFNDRGQLAFGATFTDGTSGVFISNLVAELPEPVLLGDVNRDGTVDFEDIAPFVVLLTNGGFQAEADIDENGEVNFEDIAPFIDILL